MRLRTTMLFVLLLCSVQAQEKNPMFGTVYDDPFEIPGLEHFQPVIVALAEDLPEGQRTDYVIEVFSDSTKTKGLIILAKWVTMKGTDESGTFILDTLMVDNIAADELLDIGFCRLNRKNDLSLIALRSLTSEPVVTDIHKAWRADLKRETLVPLKDLTGIDCTNTVRGGLPKSAQEVPEPKEE
jgi:hypothetical protein